MSNDPIENAENAFGIQEELQKESDSREQTILEAIKEIQQGSATGGIVVDEEEKFWFKHRRIRNFKVGEFEFKNFVIAVGRSKLPEFLEAVKGTRPIDRNNIVHIKQIENEQTLDKFQDRVMRGAASTAQIPDPTKFEPAKEENKPKTGSSVLSGFNKPKTE